jgi:hypothetical protein
VAGSRPRGSGAVCLFPLTSEPGRRLPRKFGVHGIGGQIGTVRPAHRTEFIDAHLVECRLVTQRLKDLAVNLAGQVYRARNTRHRIRRAAGISGVRRPL